MYHGDINLKPCGFVNGPNMYYGHVNPIYSLEWSPFVPRRNESNVNPSVTILQILWTLPCLSWPAMTSPKTTWSLQGLQDSSDMRKHQVKVLAMIKKSFLAQPQQIMKVQQIWPNNFQWWPQLLMISLATGLFLGLINRRVSLRLAMGNPRLPK